MNINYLRAFATVVKHQNITKAAQELRTSQPSLSKRLKKLEEFYNIKLLERSGMGVAPTSDGIEFLRFSEVILEQMQMLESRFSRRSTSRHISRLRVGSGYALSGTILPKLLAEFKKKYPSVEVDLRTNTIVALEQMITKGNLDIALSSTPPELAEMNAEPCIRVKVIAVAAKGYPVPSTKELKLRGMEQLPLIIRSSQHSRGVTETLLRKMREQGQKPKILMRCDSPEAIKTAVSNKLGVGILYEDVVKDGLARGLFKRVPIPGFPIEAQTYIVYHKTRPLSESAVGFLHILRKHCGTPRGEQVPTLYGASNVYVER